MTTRNILNYQGTIIGQLSLPDSTTEQQWSSALATYAAPPISIKEIIIDKLKDYTQASDALVSSLKADNTLAGISLAQSAQMFDDFGDILQMLREGAFPTAIYRLQQKSPSGFVTQDMINNWISKIQAAL
jgi:hypothetical protein